VAALGIVQAAPSVFLLPLVLRATRSIRGERLLTFLVAIRTLAIGLAAVVMATGAPGWIVFLAAAIDAIAATAARATRPRPAPRARAALAPRLARTTEELVASNVSISTGRSVAGLVGPALAAVLIVVRDVTSTLVVGAGLLGLALLAATTIRAAAPLPRLRGV